MISCKADGFSSHLLKTQEIRNHWIINWMANADTDRHTIIKRRKKKTVLSITSLSMLSPLFRS